GIFAYQPNTFRTGFSSLFRICVVFIFAMLAMGRTKFSVVPSWWKNMYFSVAVMKTSSLHFNGCIGGVMRGAVKSQSLILGKVSLVRNVILDVSYGLVVISKYCFLDKEDVIIKEATQAIEIMVNIIK
ncbi:TPA: hypothetical protein ACOLZV_004562, partial [Vibrio parahaemolyticus]